MNRILVTGGSGLVGSAIKDLVKNTETEKYIFTNSKECNLLDINQVDDLFKKHHPTFIIHLAAIVGGLFKNMSNNLNMFSDNILMNENILKTAFKYNIKNGIFCGTSCMFPVNPSKFPMTEEQINESPPHPSNEGYAYAKRMLELQCRNYNKTHNTNYICVIPVNLYGPNDNFNLQDGHFIPCVIHRIFNCMKDELEFRLYGSGQPVRQCMYSYDFARILLLIKENIDLFKNKKTIICTDDKQEYTINFVTELIMKHMLYNKPLLHDTNKEDGCMKKTVDTSYFKSLFPDFVFTDIDTGLKETCNWFLDNYPNIRI